MNNDGIVRMPLDYEDQNIDINAYKKESAVKRMFNRYWEKREKEALDRFQKNNNSAKFRVFSSSLEEYYGEVLELIESLPTGDLDMILKDDVPIDRLFKLIDIAKIDFSTGNKLTNN